MRRARIGAPDVQADALAEPSAGVTAARRINENFDAARGQRAISVGRIHARVALGKPVKAGLRCAPISVVFTDPQIGIVSGGFLSLQAGRFATGQMTFEAQGRARKATDILPTRRAFCHAMRSGSAEQGVPPQSP